MKIGDIINVYEDILSKKILEGKAKICEILQVDIIDKYIIYNCMVAFESDKEKFNRQIAEKIIIE